MNQVLKFKFFYKKFKFTNEIFYKKIEFAKVEIFDGRFVIEILPYINYSGTYLIMESKRHNKGFLHRVRKSFSENDELFFSPYDSFIYISDYGDVLKLCDVEMNGIIFKF